MEYDNWKLESPFNKEVEEKETNIGKCAQCLETEELYVLGFATPDRKHTDFVCSFCLNELHNSLTLTN